MAAFQENRDQAEQKVMVRLLSEIEKNHSFTQRDLATELGIALGLMNQYLKRCVTKGWVRASQVSPRRIRYFLTPEGLLEKGQMVRGYLSRSLSFFREARQQAEGILRFCGSQGVHRLGVVGEGDLLDIFHLVSMGTSVTVDSITPDKSPDYTFVAIADAEHPQQTYESVRRFVGREKILLLDLLHISQFDVASGDRFIDDRRSMK